MSTQQEHKQAQESLVMLSFDLLDAFDLHRPFGVGNKSHRSHRSSGSLGLQSCLLRRYLDPPNPPQTPSQQVLGALGAMKIMHFETTHGPPGREEAGPEPRTCTMFLFRRFFFSWGNPQMIPVLQLHHLSIVFEPRTKQKTSKPIAAASPAAGAGCPRPLGSGLVGRATRAVRNRDTTDLRRAWGLGDPNTHPSEGLGGRSLQRV